MDHIRDSDPTHSFILSRLNHIPDPLPILERILATRASGAAVIFGHVAPMPAVCFQATIGLGILELAGIGKLKEVASLQLLGTSATTLTTASPEHFVVGASFQLS